MVDVASFMTETEDKTIPMYVGFLFFYEDRGGEVAAGRTMILFQQVMVVVRCLVLALEGWKSWTVRGQELSGAGSYRPPTPMAVGSRCENATRWHHERLTRASVAAFPDGDRGSTDWLISVLESEKNENGQIGDFVLR